MIQKPFREFMCKIHGYGWLASCGGCVEQNTEYHNHYNLVLKQLVDHTGPYLFPKCTICGMRYVHDMNHSGVSVEEWAKSWNWLTV
jgi:hypothetical protein